MDKKCESGNLENKSCLEELKKDYLIIQKKYSLPSFEEFNEDFQIEKLAEIETDFLIREIRKFIAEKFSTYLRFIEAILNPVNSAIFIFAIIKTLENKDKEKLSEIYKKLAKKEVEILELDIQFSEEKEVEFIKNSYKIWKEIKNELLEIVEVINNNWDKEVEIVKKGKGYFG